MSVCVRHRLFKSGGVWALLLAALGTSVGGVSSSADPGSCLGTILKSENIWVVSRPPLVSRASTESAIQKRYPGLSSRDLNPFMDRVMEIDRSNLQASTYDTLDTLRVLAEAKELDGLDDYIVFFVKNGFAKSNMKNSVHVLEELTEARRLVEEVRLEGRSSTDRVMIGNDLTKEYGPSFDVFVVDTRTGEITRYVEVKTAKNRFVTSAFDLVRAISLAEVKADFHEKRVDHAQSRPSFEVTVPIIWDQARSAFLQSHAFFSQLLQLMNTRNGKGLFGRVRDLNAINITTTKGVLLASYVRSALGWQLQMAGVSP